MSLVQLPRGIIVRRISSSKALAVLLKQKTACFASLSVLRTPGGAVGHEAFSSTTIRWLRSRGNDHIEESHSEHEKKSHESDQQTDEPPKDDQKPEKPKVDPALLRKLQIYVLVVGGLSFIMSFFALSQMSAGRAGMEEMQSVHLTRQGIDMGTFLTKYLRAGEVRRIIFCPDYSRAVAFLQPGAVIDGKVVHELAVVVTYQQSAEQFLAEVRKEEESMGISVSDGVPLDVYKGMSTFQIIELMLGMLIIAWLATQYGRLIRQRILASKFKNGGPGTGTGGGSK